MEPNIRQRMALHRPAMAAAVWPVQSKMYEKKGLYHENEVCQNRSPCSVPDLLFFQPLYCLPRQKSRHKRMSLATTFTRRERTRMERTKPHTSATIMAPGTETTAEM